jgi:hypothetical protein
MWSPLRDTKGGRKQVATYILAADESCPAKVTKSIAHHRHSRHRMYRRRQTAANSACGVKTSLMGPATKGYRNRDSNADDGEVIPVGRP